MNRSARLSVVFVLTHSLVLLSLNAFVVGQVRTPPRTGVIIGRVVTEDGNAVDGATVTCNSGDGMAPSRTAITDAEGQFSLTGLVPAAYRIGSYSPGYVVMQGLDGPFARIGDTVNLTLVKGGVITGRVTNASGAPVVAVQVVAHRLRDQEGRAVRNDAAARTRQTDDRGIYRIYGLAAGSYHIVANPLSGEGMPATPYDLETATYYPSSNRDTATEVAVQVGAEVSGIDIRYRNTRGHTVAGTIEGGPERSAQELSVQVQALPVGGSAYPGWGNSRIVAGIRTFVLDGLSDGEYDLVARGYIWPDENILSAPIRVAVRGSDVTGIKLTLVPAGSIAGKLSVEVLLPRPGTCAKSRDAVLTEAFVRIQRDEKARETETDRQTVLRMGGTVSDAGDFLIRSLRPGPHWLVPDLPSPNWYVKAISMPGASATRRIDLGHGPLAIKPGDKITGVSVTAAEGAAGISGKLSGEKANRGRWRVHLIPVDPLQAENSLIYYEAIVADDESFSLTRLAPGKYWIIAKPIPDDQPADFAVRPVAWDTTERTRLRREAETTKAEIELKVCGRVKDYNLVVR